MSRPPKHPRRATSPTPSAISGLSDISSLNAELEYFEPGGQSPALRELYDAFESAVPFSQLDEVGGRGSQVVLQTVGLLNQVWAGRDIQNPSFCFDKHDGRTGTRIYNPPRRGPGGVVIPCSLNGANVAWNGAVQSINIVNHNVAMQSMQHSTQVPITAPAQPREANTRGERNRRTVQLTFKRKSRQEKNYNKGKDNRGRFTKKAIVSAHDLRTTAPAIPLNTRGLRRLLMQWVKGDSERGLMKPLAEFDSKDRNGKDITGKPNKTLFSKRRTVALATLLALQDAFENGRTFAEAMGVSSPGEDVEKMPLSVWEKAAKSFLRKDGRKMSMQEVIDLGKKMYSEDVIALLPTGNE